MYKNSLIKKKERCAVPQGGQIKSKGNSLIKKKERYAVPQGVQINLYGSSLMKFARKEKVKERKKERTKKKLNPSSLARAVF